jgi:hypothetical protein
LLADDVQSTPGTLFWILTNGVVRRGTPVWSKLPEAQRWQIVSYLKSLYSRRKLFPVTAGPFFAFRRFPRSEEARRRLHYFQINRHRMCYPEFHAQGLCTSTGVVEAGWKVAIGTRLKRAGMHWTVHGSNAIIALRCAKLSGRFQDFWNAERNQPPPHDPSLSCRAPSLTLWLQREQPFTSRSPPVSA